MASDDQELVVEVVRDLPDENTQAEGSNVSRAIRSLIEEAGPEFMDEVRAYYTRLQIDYLQRATALETFLGFLESAEGLGRRLERLETFLGVKSV